MLFSFLHKYPLSFLIILTITYLSFFNPPADTALAKIPNIDKIVHTIMYMGLSGMLWLEFLWGHRADKTPVWHAWIGAFFCPIVFSGIIEILQENCTTNRGGDWFDFVANITGTTLATLLLFFVIRPLIKSKVKHAKQ